MQVAILGDLGFVQHLEAVTLEHLRPAPILEDDHLPEDAPLSFFVQVFEIRVRERARAGDAAGVGEHVDVKMRRAARSGGDFAPGLA